MDDESRNYDVKEMKELDDKRFTITLREAVFAECFFFGTIAVELIASYALCPEDMEEMTYLLGLPAWFFVAACVALVSWVFVLYHNAKLSKDFSLEARDDGEDVTDNV